MPHNINNFSDLTAINTANKLEVTINLDIRGEVDYVFTINRKSIEHVQYFDLLESLSFECRVDNLVAGHSGINIQLIAVNGHQVLPLYQHIANPKTGYIDQVGIWRLDIPSPFYTWYHQLTGRVWIA
jgi:hypothetical protein